MLMHMLQWKHFSSFILYSVVLLVPLSPSNSSSYEQERRKTIAAVIYYKKLNTLSALINIYLNFKTSTYSSQTIPFQFFYFLSRLNWVGPTSAKSLGSVLGVWAASWADQVISFQYHINIISI